MQDDRRRTHGSTPRLSSRLSDRTRATDQLRCPQTRNQEICPIATCLCAACTSLRPENILMKKNMPMSPPAPPAPSESAPLPCRCSALLGRHLRDWRRSQHLPLKHLATDLGVSCAIVSAWETGTRFPVTAGVKMPFLVGKQFPLKVGTQIAVNEREKALDRYQLAVFPGDRSFSVQNMAFGLFSARRKQRKGIFKIGGRRDVSKWCSHSPLSAIWISWLPTSASLLAAYSAKVPKQRAQTCESSYKRLCLQIVET